MAIVCKYCQGRGFIVLESEDREIKQHCETCEGTGTLPEEPDFTLDDLEWSELYE